MHLIFSNNQLHHLYLQCWSKNSTLIQFINNYWQFADVKKGLENLQKNLWYLYFFSREILFHHRNILSWSRYTSFSLLAAIYSPFLKFQMIYLITDFVDVLLIMPLLSEKENIDIIKNRGGCVLDLRLRTVHVLTLRGC